jgi:DNA-directed RNA polymerase specialized sigma24 family protein
MEEVTRTELQEEQVSQEVQEKKKKVYRLNDLVTDEQIFTLHLLDDLSFKAIACMYGVHVKTIQRHYRTFMNRLGDIPDEKLPFFPSGKYNLPKPQGFFGRIKEWFMSWAG